MERVFMAGPPMVALFDLGLVTTGGGGASSSSSENKELNQDEGASSGAGKGEGGGEGLSSSFTGTRDTVMLQGVVVGQDGVAVGDS